MKEIDYFLFASFSEDDCILNLSPVHDISYILKIINN